MEKKPVANAAPKKRASLGEYFKGVKTEIKKVVWPTKHELASYTGVVVVTCFAFAAAIAVVDNVLLMLLKQLLGISI